MPPCPAARRPPRTRHRPPWIMLRRRRVVAGIVAVRAPFVNVLAHVEKPVPVGWRRPYRLRAFSPAVLVVLPFEKPLVAPRIQVLLQPAARRPLPLGFGRKAELPVPDCRQPFAVIQI